MINRRALAIFFVLVLLFPVVFAAEYKQVKSMNFPKCYGNITFKIEGTPPVDSDSRDFEIIGCPRPRPLHCPCAEGEQTLQFSVLDNVSNTLLVTAQYYIGPHIEFVANESQQYDPNEDYKRLETWAITVQPTVPVESETEQKGVPVSSTKVLIVILIVISVIALGIMIALKMLNKGDKKDEVKPKSFMNMPQKKQPVVKPQQQSNDDVKKYLEELDNERRK